MNVDDIWERALNSANLIQECMELEDVLIYYHILSRKLTFEEYLSMTYVEMITVRESMKAVRDMIKSVLP